MLRKDPKDILTSWRNQKKRWKNIGNYLRKEKVSRKVDFFPERKEYLWVKDDRNATATEKPDKFLINSQ